MSPVNGKAESAAVGWLNRDKFLLITESYTSLFDLRIPSFFPTTRVSNSESQKAACSWTNTGKIFVGSWH